MSGQTLQDLQLLDILPPSITWDGTVQALARAVDPIHQDVTATIPVDIIYAALEALPDDILDVVAWGFHIEGYDLLETRAEKLHVVANFYDYHRYKGTVHGLELYLRTYLKRDLLACSPPTKSYCGASLTDAERAAWSANMPEIRVYPFRHAGTRQGAFVGDFLGAMYPNTSDAILRIGDQVTLNDPVDGSETKLDSLTTSRDVTTRLAAKHVTVRLPGTAGRAMFIGRCLAGYATADTGAASRIYELDMAVGYEDEIARRHALSVRPSLAPVKIGSDEVASPGTRGRGIYLGHRWPDAYPERAACFLEGSFPVPSSAGDRLYRMTKLYDASREVFSRRATSTFLGAFKLGAVRPHYAEAAVDMLRPAPARAMFLGQHFGQRHTCDLDAQAWIDRMCRVGRMAMRLSDRILVSTSNRRQIQASESLVCGSVVCGAYQLEAF
ncbi:phage tail protein [Solidesulfovibrio sp.]